MSWSVIVDRRPPPAALASTWPTFRFRHTQRFTDASPTPNSSADLGIGALASLVGCDDALAKRDWMTVNHHPDQIRNGSAIQGPGSNHSNTGVRCGMR